jgi:hypothetical protein
VLLVLLEQQGQQALMVQQVLQELQVPLGQQAQRAQLDLLVQATSAYFY